MRKLGRVYQARIFFYLNYLLVLRYRGGISSRFRQDVPQSFFFIDSLRFGTTEYTLVQAKILRTCDFTLIFVVSCKLSSSMGPSEAVSHLSV